MPAHKQSSSSLTDSRWAKLHEQISSIVTLLGDCGQEGHDNDDSRYVSTLLIHTLLMLEDYRALRQFIEQGQKGVSADKEHVLQALNWRYDELVDEGRAQLADVDEGDREQLDVVRS